MSAEAPRDVRVNLVDGRSLPVRLRHVGQASDGCDRWEAILDLDPDEVRDVQIGELPGRCAIDFRFGGAPVHFDGPNR